MPVYSVQASQPALSLQQCDYQNTATGSIQRRTPAYSVQSMRVPGYSERQTGSQEPAHGVPDRV